MSAIPVIETERLILRAFEPDDLDSYAAIESDTEVMRYISGAPVPRETVWVNLLRHRGMWAAMGFGFFAVVDKADGALIGEAGLQDRQRDMMPSLDGTLEAGWIFAARAQGKGYAREAMRAVLNWRDTAHSEKPVTCIIHPENRRSIALANDLGFKEQARTVYHDGPVIIFRRG